MEATSPAEAVRKRRRVGLRVKIVGLAVGAALLIAATQMAVFTVQMRRVLIDQLRQRGEAIGEAIAASLTPVLAGADGATVRREVDRARREHPDLGYLVLRGASGEVLAFAAHPKLGSVDSEALPRESAKARVTAGSPRTLGSSLVLPMTVRLESEQRAGSVAPARIGELQLGFDLTAASEATQRATVRALLWGLLALLLCAGAGILLSRVIADPLERLTRVAAGMAAGDLSQRVEIQGEDEIGELAQSFASMSEGLRAMIGQLRQAASAVEAEATDILSTSTQQSAMSSQQASAINETSTTVREIAQTSEQATEHADAVIQLAQRSEELSRDGQRVVEETTEALNNLSDQVKAIARSITELSERTLQIGDIIATVKELAEQSNLLALNASIEAAKAGEHGRGFAVVAMEMRTLAEQSKVAAGEVRAILSDVQKRTRAAVAATEEGSVRAQSAVELARRAGSSITGLAEVIRDSSLAARQIASNTRQQTVGVEQIVAAIGELSSATADALEGTRRIETVAGNLNTVARSLSQVVHRYRV